MAVEDLMPLVASGKVAIPANKLHTCIDPEGIGSMLRTKINVNLGVSKDCKDYDVEMQKVLSAVNMGAEAIMDLSSHGNTQPFRRKLTSECPAMIGTVPVYDSVIHYQRDLDTLTAKDFIDVIRLHAEDGVDFVTLHCGITRKTIDQIRKHKRKMNIVSRGGALVFAWMCMTGEENPFYEYYDEILDICREYDVTISLGDACRPGCLADATDVCQIEELVRLGELTKRAWEKDVQVMVEGPGHVPMDQIAANMKVQQTICMGAPFYVLGPLVTDIAPGYDHITAAIGGAVREKERFSLRNRSFSAFPKSFSISPILRRNGLLCAIRSSSHRAPLSRAPAQIYGQWLRSVLPSPDPASSRRRVPQDKLLPSRSSRCSTAAPPAPG